ncbi:MAG: hypothetical protein NT003_02485 [Candidatus Magasanikbacteria bacterium]|nr:hypothetical protein [Candidatus Magasanikbacteria bacterium]
MDLSRLKHVRDICPLNASHHATITASKWVLPIAARGRPIAIFEHGHSIALVSNRILTWHRSFTRTTNAPPKFDPPSYIYIHEWVSDVQPKPHEYAGWVPFGFASKQGVTFLDERDHTSLWSSHARRHLKIFQKSGATIRNGTIEEFKKNSHNCYLGESVLEHVLDQTIAVLEERPEDLEIYVAELASEPIGFFIVAHCTEVSQSYYIGGFYTAVGSKQQAITGLINHWFKRSRELGLPHVNFGDMCGPWTPKFDPSIGYSNFKTHFGIHRVWHPQTLWKIRFRLFNLDAVDSTTPGVEIKKPTL